MIFIGFGLKIVNGFHESGVAVRRIGRDGYIIVIILKLECKLKRKVSPTALFLEARAMICDILAISVPSIPLFFCVLQRKDQRFHAQSEK